jgi:uncharacterized protein (DUF2384 family)
MPQLKTLSKTDVLILADDVFGTHEKSLGWLNFPNTRLDGAKPVSLLETDDGIQTVASVLWSIAEGIYT